MHPKKLSISDYSYVLPEEKIAFHPLTSRDQSKLLIYKNGCLQQDIYSNISKYLPADSVAIFNNTKVVEARLLFQKPSGGTIEIFCLEPHEKYGDITNAMQQRSKIDWLCFVGGASKWKNGQVLEKIIKDGAKEITLCAAYKDKRADSFVIELKWNDASLSFAEILHLAGQIPLPPYIKRKPENEDTVRYQTVYAAYDGSVAAPTAGLHFTQKILNDLKDRNIDIDFITLHVGAGTFKPVKTVTLENHEMHAEFIEIERKVIEKILHNLHKPIIAIGTTTLRSIESLYWLGCKLLQNENIFDNETPLLSQWEVYDLQTQNYTTEAALKALLHFLEKQATGKLLAKTQIIIAPGYSFKIATALVTNFHQPASTLLLLVAAFIGNDWHKVYNYALQNDFRFLSYGDGSLLWRTAES